ncbi:hypothetical protein ABZ590_40665, partial [Streptomyces hirsutus]
AHGPRSCPSSCPPRTAHTVCGPLIRPSRCRRMPGIGKKGAQKLLLELKDRLGAPVGTATAAGPVTAGWRDQLHAALIGLGYATREADEAVAAVTPQAEAAEGTPQVGALLKAALQSLNRAR